MFGVKKASKKEDVKCTCESSSNKKQTVASGNKNLKARSENRKSIVESQFGGGGGGMNAPGMGAGGPASGGTTLPAQPAGGMQMPDPQDVGAFSEEQTADSVDDNIESMPPGSICPSCGSDDVDVKGGNFGCNNCGAEGQIEVNVKVTNWPDTIKEQGPGEGAGEGDEIDEGIGEMEGGPGMEIPDAGIPDAGIPNIGVAAVFNVTPEMVKISEQKPIGSFCPHCGSSKVRLAEDTHSGQCRTCDGRYRIDTYWGPSDNCLIARVAWFDNNVRKLAIANIKKITQAKRTAIKNASNLNQKRDILATALKAKGWTKRFSAAGLKDKAIMIGELAEQGLIRKD
jgi:ribosomal protein L37AE/L43A